MDRKIETMFDVVTIKHDAVTLDSTELSDMCVEQRSMTMRRIASWLRNNARIFELESETIVSNEIKNLANDLDYLSTIQDAIL